MKIKRRQILTGSIALGVLGIFVVLYMTGVGQSKNARAEHFYQKAAKLIKSNSYDEKQVVELIKKALELNSEHDEALLLWGNIYEYGSHRYPDKAEEKYMAVLEKNPDHARANLFIGGLYVHTGEYEKGIPHLRKAIGAGSKSQAHLLLGLAYMETGKFIQAEEELNTHIKNWPDDAAGYAVLARLFSTQGRFEDTIINFEKALQRDDMTYTAVVGVGRRYVGEKKFQEAINLYRRALKIVRTEPLEVALREAEAKLGR